MSDTTRFLIGDSALHAPVSDETSFDGVRFSDHNIVVERIHDTIPDMRTELAERVGGHGSMLRSLYMGSRDISLECRLFTESWGQYDESMQRIMGWLVGRTARLRLRNHPDQYYDAFFRSMEEGERDAFSCGLTINFTAPNPLRRDVRERVVITNANSLADAKRFEIGGTDLAEMTIDVRGATSVPEVYVRSLSGNGTDGDIRANLDGMGSGIVTTYDCRTHSVRTWDPSTGRDAFADNNYTATPGVELYCRWPKLAPGKWLAYVSDGTATLTWRQTYR